MTVDEAGVNITSERTIAALREQGLNMDDLNADPDAVRRIAEVAVDCLGG
jgi:hypothetical protein